MTHTITISEPGTATCSCGLYSAKFPLGLTEDEAEAIGEAIARHISGADSRYDQRKYSETANAPRRISRSAVPIPAFPRTSETHQELRKVPLRPIRLRLPIATVLAARLTKLREVWSEQSRGC